MRIIIVANNHLLNKDHIDLLNPSNDDVFFLFNYMYKSYDITKEYRKIAFLRGIGKQDEFLSDTYYLGGGQFIDIQSGFQKLVLIWKEYYEYSKNIYIPTNILLIKEILDEYDIDYPGESPSSGFLSVLYAKKYFKDHEIVLLGFTGRFPDGNEPREDFVHNYKWELDYYKKESITMIKLD